MLNTKKKAIWFILATPISIALLIPILLWWMERRLDLTPMGCTSMMSYCAPPPDWILLVDAIARHASTVIFFGSICMSIYGIFSLIQLKRKKIDINKKTSD